MSGRKWMGSAAGAIAVLLTGIGAPIAAPAQEMPAPPAAPQDPALYSYLDNADALLAAMGTSPPDYGFRFEGIDCWAWSMSDGYLVLAEPLGDDYRFYVFSPDDDHPFFVGDQFYAYGFEGRALAAIYGANGDLIAWNPSDEIAAGGAWLSDRGSRMRHALQAREPVYAGDWADSIGWFGAIELRFDSWRSRPGWIRYRDGPGRLHHRDWRNKLGTEWQKRRQRAEWFERWRRGGYRGAPQGGGKWVTTPGGERPGRKGGPEAWKGKGNWIGRPRPVAPQTPGVPGAKPGGAGRGDDARPVFPRRPPRLGQPIPGQPIPTPPVAPVTSTPLPPPVVVPPPPRRGDAGRPTRLPPRIQSDMPTAVPPTAPAPAPQAPPILRGERRIERPMLVVPKPPVVKSDTGKPMELQPLERRPISPRVEPRPLPPPAVVPPRPSFSPPRAPVSAPPPPPPPSPPPAAAARPVPPMARPAGPVSGVRSSSGAVRGEGRARPGGKGKEQ